MTHRCQVRGLGREPSMPGVPDGEGPSAPAAGAAPGASAREGLLTHMSVFDPGPHPWKRGGPYDSEGSMDGHSNDRIGFLWRHCKHDPTPEFDPAAARGLPSEEVRKRWPRAKCSMCGAMLYASEEHYLAGDW